MPAPPRSHRSNPYPPSWVLTRFSSHFCRCARTPPIHQSMACRFVARHFLSHLRPQAPRPLPVPSLTLGVITRCVGPSSSPAVAPQGVGWSNSIDSSLSRVAINGGLMLLIIIEELFSPQMVTRCHSPWKSRLRATDSWEIWIMRIWKIFEGSSVGHCLRTVKFSEHWVPEDLRSQIFQWLQA
jgi:hypothetical protein